MRVATAMLVCVAGMQLYTCRRSNTMYGDQQSTNTVKKMLYQNIKVFGVERYGMYNMYIATKAGKQRVPSEFKEFASSLRRILVENDGLSERAGS